MRSIRQVRVTLYFIETQSPLEWRHFTASSSMTGNFEV